MNPDSPIGDPKRLAAVVASHLTDPAIDPSLDRLTRLVCLALNVPVALVSLVEKERQFFKSQCGLQEPWASLRETPLSHSFCQHVVMSEEPLLIIDSRTDVRVLNNLAVPELGVIAYAGVPIIDPDGYTLGSLCAIDTKPREWSADEVKLLHALSTQISAEMSIRVQSAKLADEIVTQRTELRKRDTMLRLNVHDIRTPLSAMLLGMKMLDMLGPLNEEQQEFLTISKRNGDAIVNMVNNLLDIGNIEERGVAAISRIACEPCHLIELALDQSFLLAAEKNQTLKTCVSAGVAKVFVDEDKLTRVIVNLVGNAIKFTPEGGKIEVGAVTSADAKSVQFSVRDNGIGMSSAERIFDEGVRLDTHASTARSTGLGLTFCKRIVEIHGGAIWVETQLGFGSTFYFTVPLAK